MWCKPVHCDLAVPTGRCRQTSQQIGVGKGTNSVLWAKHSTGDLRLHNRSVLCGLRWGSCSMQRPKRTHPKPQRHLLPMPQVHAPCDVARCHRCVAGCSLPGTARKGTRAIALRRCRLEVAMSASLRGTREPVGKSYKNEPAAFRHSYTRGQM